MQHLKQTVWVLIIFLQLIADPASARILTEKGDHYSKKDTASAVVLYGDSTFLKTELTRQESDYQLYLDSLLNNEILGKEETNQVRLIRSVERKSRNEVADMIDSLFSLKEVPYALINEINLYISVLEERRMEESLFPADRAHPSPHPAQCFYDVWDTERPNPYKFPEADLDSVVLLKLRDTIQFCDFSHPHLGPVTSRFGWRYGRRHNGIDVDLEVWDPVHTAFAGQVRVAKVYGGYGRVVVVRHYNGLETLYAHLHRFKVEAGDYVEAGDVIGLGGSSGRSSGSHLHFEVRFRGIPVNPEHLISFSDGSLIGDTLVLNKIPHGYGARTSNTTIHKVKKGEYLYLIAERYGVTLDDICRYNGIRRNTVLHVGQRLRISG